MFKRVIAGILFFGFIFSTHAMAEESPDELYRQGRFAEAEKSYALLDMDHPKDIRYRYNRGVAAYQNSDFQGAAAAFSSVLRRTKDKEVRFRSAFNLGNTAYKQGDFESAVSFYKQSILDNPSSEETGYNLELALRALEKQKKKNEDSPPQSQKDGDQGEEKKSPSESEKKDEGEHKPSKEKPSEGSKPKDQKDGKDKTESGEDKKDEKKSPKDLSGELKSLQELPEKKEEDQSPGSMIDRKKAEALLDNIKEDRSRFLRFQIPKDKRYGVSSGKDW